MEQLSPPDDPMYLIPASLLQAVVEYMGARPFKEVGGAMPALLALKPLDKRGPDDVPTPS